MLASNLHRPGFFVSSWFLLTQIPTWILFSLSLSLYVYMLRRPNSQQTKHTQTCESLKNSLIIKMHGALRKNVNKKTGNLTIVGSVSDF